MDSTTYIRSFATAVALGALSFAGLAAVSTTTATPGEAPMSPPAAPYGPDKALSVHEHPDGSSSFTWADETFASPVQARAAKKSMQTKGKGRYKVRAPRAAIVKSRYVVTAGIPWKRTAGKVGKKKRVVLAQVKGPGKKKYRTVKKLRTGKARSVSLRHRPTRAGAYRYRFVAPKRAKLRRYVSPAVKVKVKRPPRKAATPVPTPAPTPITPAPVIPAPRPTAPTTAPTVPPPTATVPTSAPTIPAPTPRPTATATTDPVPTPSDGPIIPPIWTQVPTPTPEPTPPPPVWTEPPYVPPPPYVDPPAVTPPNWDKPWDPPEFRAPDEPALVGDPSTWTSIRGDENITWSNCKTITWAYNPDGGFDGSLAIAKRAVARIAGASGLRFKYVGTTTQRPFLSGWTVNEHGRFPDYSYSRAADIRIGWLGQHEHPGSYKDFPLMGLATVARYESDFALADIMLSIDSQSVATPTLFPDTNAWPKLSWGATMMHELGHAVGLGHTSSTGPHSGDKPPGWTPVDVTEFPGASPYGWDQLMHGRSSREASWFGASDMAGLAHMGSNPTGAGC